MASQLYQVSGSATWTFALSGLAIAEPPDDWNPQEQTQLVESRFKGVFQNTPQQSMQVGQQEAHSFILNHTFSGKTYRNNAILTSVLKGIASALTTWPNVLVSVRIDNLTSRVSAGLIEEAPSRWLTGSVATTGMDHFQGLCALAMYHVNAGTQRSKFNIIPEELGFATANESDKIPIELARIGNKGLSQVDLKQPTDNGDNDQQSHDDAQMVLTYLNARVAPDLIAAKPGGYDMTDAGDQLLYMAATANATAKYISTNLAALETAKIMASADSVKKYRTDEIHMEFVTDLFKGFGLTPDAIGSLTTLAKNFLSNISNLSASSSQTDITTRQYVICSTLDPVPNQPSLAKESTLRTFLVTFQEHTHEWSDACSSGKDYTLHTNNFSLEVGLNREMTRMMHDTLTKWCCSALISGNQPLQPTDIEQMSKENTTTIPGKAPPPPI